MSIKMPPASLTPSIFDDMAVNCISGISQRDTTSHER
ncbi:hypothetical protein A2U01_0117917, partial [Trifolium medium]|nr:hypothetical protein [Trifolium medium]